VTSADSPLTNALTGRYTIERELGRGGMATVYLARDLRHDRPVALKIMHPELAATLGPERFLREVRTTARLQHPHILPVLDSGETQGQLWYTMPYVRGESLRDRLRRESQLPVETALELARQIALALDCAHREGVVHRDLKPENILLSDGQALVADFGVAKAFEAGGERLTETGLAVGTPVYMAPEQASGGVVDARSDIYTLGSVLYEMLAGEPPFSGPTAQAIIARQLTEAPRPLRQLRETVPEAVALAVAKALAKAPADRFSTASEFARALAAPVTTLATSTAVSTPATRPGPAPAGSPTRRRVPVVAVALGLGFLIGVGILFAWWRTGIGGNAEDASGPKRLVVLPFENLGDSADAYFADGMTNEIRGKLASLPGLEVIARASSERYDRSTKSPQQIGRELRVDYLLTGTVRWAKRADGTSRVQVTPELVRTASAATTWQAPFEAPLTDVFQVQADIAGRAAHALDVALSDSARRVLAQHPTGSLDAYTLYLRGRYHWNTRTREGLAKAVTYFQQAIERDSAYALAYAGLADAYLNLADYRFLPGAEAIRKAKGMAGRALELDETLAEAHASLGGVLESERDWRGAEAEYRRAIALDPNYPTVHQWYALLLPKLGRSTEAIREIRRAQALDPLSLPINNDVGVVLQDTGDSAAAIEEFRRTLTMEPEYPWALSALGMAYAATGRREEAIQVLRKALDLVPGDAEVLANLGYAYARAGRREEAQAMIGRLKSPVDGRPSPFYAGLVYAALGERDSAFHWLDRAHPEARSIFLTEDDPQLTALRPDPRFRRLIRRFGVGPREPP